MVEILKEVSDQYLKEAVLNNLLELCRFRAQSLKITLRDSDELFRYDMGSTSFSMQGVFYTNLKPDIAEKRIDEVIEYFTTRNMPFFWLHNPGYCKPDNIGDILEAHSFKKMEGTPGMAVDLEQIRDDRPTPPGLTVKQVDNEKSNRVFWKVWSEGYPMPEDVAAFDADSAEEIGFYPDNPWKLFLGYLDGEPVSTSFIFFGGGVVGLYGVVTLPEARNRGLGTAMSLHALRLARSLGYRVAVLDATQQGIGLYRRMGFKEVSWPVIYTYQSPSVASVDERMKDFMHSQRK
jgi:ribosomal protein S18 acetylase RimI-like enzyme